ncbi:aminopeptidase Y [Saccharomycopsis crataegensis]|uniref:Peptide hydrolase n=1 Tax=Saccharomycopsis crataegensis TaxID=43959 RepID=A0AAV5QVI3_9ASCO|nr:aminopeptidase Y [Saccharomycopsis crataegensis]
MLLNYGVLAQLVIAVHGMSIPFVDSYFKSSQSVLAGSIQSTLDDIASISQKQQHVDISKLPPLDSEELQSLINPEDLEYHANVLYNLSKTSIDEFGNPTRVIGSSGHFATINHILSVFNKYHWYYDITVQPFTTVISKIESAKLYLNNEEPANYAGLDLTPPTKNNGEFVNGTLVYIKNQGCEDADYEDLVAAYEKDSSVDYVALIERGVCSFGDKSRKAGKYNAQAAIVFDNEDTDDILHGTLGEPQGGEVPSISIVRSLAKHYIDNFLSQGKTVDVSVAIDSYVKSVVTKNVIAETRFGDKNNIVMAGAHTDSVTAGPGINDDGTGTISLLVLAEQLTKYRPTNAIRLGFWAAEEEGLIGSTYYVEQLTAEENARHRLFLDYDMMASPNYAYQVYDGNNIDNPAGSQEIKDLYIDWYVSQGLNYTLIPFDGRSDYAAFIENNIPGGGIATGAEGIKTPEEVAMFGGEAGEWYDHCYHQLCDDLTNVDYEAWEFNTKLIAHSVATYGFSLDGFPAKKAASEINTQSKETPQFKYRGGNLIF